MQPIMLGFIVHSAQYCSAVLLSCKFWTIFISLYIFCTYFVLLLTQDYFVIRVPILIPHICFLCSLLQQYFYRASVLICQYFEQVCFAFDGWYLSNFDAFWYCTDCTHCILVLVLLVQFCTPVLLYFQLPLSVCTESYSSVPLCGGQMCCLIFQSSVAQFVQYLRASCASFLCLEVLLSLCSIFLRAFLLSP